MDRGDFGRSRGKLVPGLAQYKKRTSRKVMDLFLKGGQVEAHLSRLPHGSIGPKVQWTGLEPASS